MADNLSSPYRTSFENPDGPGDFRPTALQIVKDNDLIGKWTGKVVLVTGATSGIGVQTARALHSTGAHVFITARDPKKGQKTVDYILKNSPGNGEITVIALNLDSLESARNAAADFLKLSDKLNILVNNAGIMATPKSTTIDGFERQFGVNHLAHFTLTALLLPVLIRSSTPDLNSRVIAVSSSSHRYQSIEFDDINLDKSYEPYKAYGQSKTGNIWLTNYIDRNYGARGVHAFSVHPGGIWSGLQEYVDPDQIAKWKKDPETMRNMLNEEQGAATSVWAATAKSLSGKGGMYLSNCSIAPPATQMTSPLDPGYAPHTYDEEGENLLWELSSKMTGVTVSE